MKDIEYMCYDCPTPDACDRCPYSRKENQKARKQQRDRERKDKKRRYQENFD